ncbi:flavodoxin [Chakrabartyella piscis]|uniref:flavodoxin n=1 Tax=Chakrabartyella piscis TaxID=2918914 RepID=UPI002958969F|nr:flavodoxin [Chakrabartyella piscis]
MTNLIVFFSRADENYVCGVLKNLEIGNTKQIASTIEGLIPADVFEIKMKTPYSKGYNQCLDEVQTDLRKNKRPALENQLSSIDGYDTIYLGYPNYWGTMPMAVFTFLEQFDFTGKTIRPFCTHEGSGFGNSLKDIKKLCPTAKVEKGIAILGSQWNMATGEIESWLRSGGR